MSDPRSLLERWARLKNATRASRLGQGRKEQPVADSSVPKAEQTFDPEKLPPIETINAATELRAFLGEGVPAELALAALRRGWSADPAIRDFVGLSENSWNFNDPGAMSGFGTLKAEDIRWLAAQIVEQPEAIGAATGDQAYATSATVRADASPGEPVEPESIPEGASSVDPKSAQEAEACFKSSDPIVTSRPARSSTGQHADDRPSLRPRRHGGAVPRTG